MSKETSLPANAESIKSSSEEVGAADVHPIADNPLDYNAKAKHGIKAMIGRQALMQIITFAGGIILARILSPEMFGIFGICTFFVQTLSLFGDCGLAAALVQQKQKLSDSEIQVAFTFQQVLLAIISVGVWIAGPKFASLYPASDQLQIIWLVRILAGSLFLQSWRSISILQLERQLHFGLVAKIEVAETIAYQASATILAFAGFGLWSLVVAVLLRGVVGVGTSYYFHPWRIKYAWDKAIFRQLLSFGIPFQLGSIISSLSSWIVPVAIGSTVGPIAVGYIGWASALGNKPNTLVGSVTRVAFPHFSRIQSSIHELERVAEIYLYASLAFCGLWAAEILSVGNIAVDVIYTSKWLPAIDALQIYAAASLFGIATLMALPILRGTGKPWFTVVIGAIHAAICLLVVVSLLPTQGWMSAVIAGSLASACTCIVAFAMLPFRGLKLLATCALPPLLGMGASFLITYSLGRPTSVVNASVLSILVATVYIAIVSLLSPNRIRTRLIIRLTSVRPFSIALTRIKN